MADWPIIIKENRLLHLLKKKEVTPGQSQIDRSSDTAPAWYPSEKWNERKGYLIFCLSPVFQPFTIDFKDQYTIWQLFDRNHLQVVVVWVQVLAVLLDKCLEKKVSLWGCSPRQKGIWYYDDDKENDNNDYDENGCHHCKDDNGENDNDDDKYGDDNDDKYINDDKYGDDYDVNDAKDDTWQASTLPFSSLTSSSPMD